jgi:hypothetical protein
MPPQSSVRPASDRMCRRSVSESGQFSSRLRSSRTWVWIPLRARAVGAVLLERVAARMAERVRYAAAPPVGVPLLQGEVQRVVGRLPDALDRQDTVLERPDVVAGRAHPRARVQHRIGPVVDLAEHVVPGERVGVVGAGPERGDVVDAVEQVAAPHVDVVGRDRQRRHQLALEPHRELVEKRLVPPLVVEVDAGFVERLVVRGKEREDIVVVHQRAVGVAVALV